MADRTKIEWTDATVNAVNGCSVLSPGCKHCYAMKQAHRVSFRRDLVSSTAGGQVWNGKVYLHEKALLEPLRLKKPRMIFWNAHGDLFHPNVPDEWIDRVFAVCALTPQHTHQILTKRPERMREYLVARKSAAPLSIPVGDGTLTDHPWNNELKVPGNVWLGVSVEDQKRADERIPHLLATPAAVRWLSCEPLLGPVDLTALEVNQGYDEMDALNPINISAEWREWCEADDRPDADDDPEVLADFVEQYGRVPDGKPIHPTVNWVVVGGESGPGARPMHPDWARSLRDQCQAAGVPFLFKQWGEWLPCEADHDDYGKLICYPDDGSERSDVIPEGAIRQVTQLGQQDFWRVGKKAAGRLLDGVQHDGFPA